MLTGEVTSGALVVVRGQVQGVGFRPTVWRLAREIGLSGDVSNTSDGVRIRLWGSRIDEFVDRLRAEAPPLARIQDLDRQEIEGRAPESFEISETTAGTMRVAITPDITICNECREEINDPFAPRFRYPFTNCTNCGPRFSIISAAPYDRAKTSMQAFDMCDTCRAEYENPEDRRYHAQPIACHKCGPRVWIEKLGHGTVNSESFSMLDDIDAVGGMITSGHIVAVKGIGGFHLACDATNEDAVARLRRLKKRPTKALALMARDVDMVLQYAKANEKEIEALSGPEAPIVLLEDRKDNPLPSEIAPGLAQLGFMLPYSPLHELMFKRVKRPIVMTSGNVSGEPQCTGNGEVRTRLDSVADFACMTDRDIVNRIDDSVVRVDRDVPRTLRRARGFAPSSLQLPKGIPTTQGVLAFGADLKNTFCLTKDAEGILSQHMGDLSDPFTEDDLLKNLGLFEQLFEHSPDLIAVDRHPEYRSSKLGRRMAVEKGLPIIEIQHHHAHIAACMVENNWPHDGNRVLGVALDGAGWGMDGTVWGGEFLACDYESFQRLATFKPVPLLGGDAAAREPWRNAYAHITAEMGWSEFSMNFNQLEIFQYLSAKPRTTLDGMISGGMNSPLTSSCGRLFDAAAAIVGLSRETQTYEGEAAMLFEAALDHEALSENAELDYPFTIPLIGGSGLPYIEPLAVWRAMLGDLVLGTSIGVISARFHRGLARTIVAMINRLQGDEVPYAAVALSGGCFQNRTLFTLVCEALEHGGTKVLTHQAVPANDGGIALGQAAIAAATFQKIRERT
ncbi:MAG: carbamoyltransferase HypF [Pseudomonadota bacterium]|jgi:hydrogenase maturation protein HypF